MTDFKINDLVTIGRKWFMDNKVHKGRIVQISTNGQRFVIESSTYPHRFSISKKNCRKVKELISVEA